MLLQSTLVTRIINNLLIKHYCAVIINSIYKLDMTFLIKTYKSLLTVSSTLESAKGSYARCSFLVDFASLVAAAISS